MNDAIIADREARLWLNVIVNIVEVIDVIFGDSIHHFTSRLHERKSIWKPTIIRLVANAFLPIVFATETPRSRVVNSIVVCAITSFR